MKIRIQPDGFSCGVYSIINALIVYGQRATRNRVVALTETDRNGTDEEQLTYALTELGYKCRVYETKNPDYAWRWVLKKSINQPLILYVNKDHWLTVGGRVRNKVILLDSADTAHIVGKEELLKRWKIQGRYWGISITAKKECR